MDCKRKLIFSRWASNSSSSTSPSTERNSLQVRIEIALEVVELFGHVEDLRAIDFRHGDVLLKQIGIAAGFVRRGCPLEMRVAVGPYRDGVRLPGNSLAPVKDEGHYGLRGSRSGCRLCRSRED